MPLYMSNTESACILLSINERTELEGAESSRLENLYREASDPVLRSNLTNYHWWP